MLFIIEMAAAASSPPSSSSSSLRSTISPDEMIVLFFEDKSRGEDSDRNQPWWGHFIQANAAQGEKGPYDQYAKFCEVVGSITESDLEDDQGGYLRALMEGRFLLMYVTTRPQCISLRRTCRQLPWCAGLDQGLSGFWISLSICMRCEYR